MTLKQHETSENRVQSFTVLQLCFTNSCAKIGIPQECYKHLMIFINSEQRISYEA